MEPSEAVASSEALPLEKLDDSKETESPESDQLKEVEMMDQSNELEKRDSLRKNESKVNEPEDQSGISESTESFTADEVVKVVKKPEPSVHELFSDETGWIEETIDKESGPDENERSEALTGELASKIIEVQEEFWQEKNPESAIPNPAENTPAQPVQEESLSKTMGLLEKQNELFQAQKMEELEETPPEETSDMKNLSGFSIDTGKTDESADVQSPIIYSSHSMDFSDDSERDESPQKKDSNPVVRFVKGGSFDD